MCADALGSPVHPGELVIDGGTLSHVLGTPSEALLASCGARCGSVVICRSSPAQKAAIVRVMTDYEMLQVRLVLDPGVQGYARASNACSTWEHGNQEVAVRGGVAPACGCSAAAGWGFSQPSVHPAAADQGCAHHRRRAAARGSCGGTSGR